MRRPRRKRQWDKSEALGKCRSSSLRTLSQVSLKMVVTYPAYWERWITRIAGQAIGGTLSRADISEAVPPLRRHEEGSSSQAGLAQ